MTKYEYQDEIKNIVQSNLNYVDKFEKFEALWTQLHEEEWFKLELENAIHKEVDKFVDVRDISLGDKNYFYKMI